MCCFVVGLLSCCVVALLVYNVSLNCWFVVLRRCCSRVAIAVSFCCAGVVLLLCCGVVLLRCRCAALLLSGFVDSLECCGVAGLRCGLAGVVLYCVFVVMRVCRAGVLLYCCDIVVLRC